MVDGVAGGLKILMEFIIAAWAFSSGFKASLQLLMTELLSRFGSRSCCLRNDDEVPKYKRSLQNLWAKQMEKWLESRVLTQSYRRWYGLNLQGWMDLTIWFDALSVRASPKQRMPCGTIQLPFLFSCLSVHTVQDIRAEASLTTPY